MKYHVPSRDNSGEFIKVENIAEIENDLSVAKVKQQDMIDEAIVDVAHVMGKLGSGTANDGIYEIAPQSKRIKLFDSKQKLRLMPD